MTDEQRAELRRAFTTLIQAVESDSHLAWMTLHSLNSVVKSAAGFGPFSDLAPRRHLALSVLTSEPDTVVTNALADMLLDAGHEYATAVAEKARVEGEKAGIEQEKARCLHLLGFARTYFDRGHSRTADELAEAIRGNLKPSPKVFVGSAMRHGY